MAYRIKTVASLTGLTSSTLRAWERRYGLLSPARTSGGYRVYTEDDVARLMRIKSLLDTGFKVSEAIALVEREALPLAPADATSESLDEIRAELLDALLDVDRPQAGRIAGRLASLPFERRIDEILLPVVREVGACWSMGTANVAQEHFASAFVRELIARMLADLDAGPAAGPEIVCAAPPGEEHEIGLLAFGVHSALRGWRVTYLGGNVPLEDLRALLAERPPRLLASAVIRHREIDECAELFRGLRANAPAATAILVGGHGMPHELAGITEPVAALRELGDALRSPLLDPNRA